MDIVKHISNLIYDYECVVIPELGGFISSYQPASIHPVQHQFNPPAKKLMFNEALKSNDGLLANYIATSQRVSYEAAMEGIREFVKMAKSALSNGEAVTFENIGSIYLGYDGNLQFDQNDSVNYLKDVYGMSSFVSPAIRREATAAPKVVKPVFSNRPDQDRKKRNAGLFIRIAATVMVLATLGIFGFVYLKNTTPNTQESNLFTAFNELVNHNAEADKPETILEQNTDRVEVKNHNLGVDLEEDDIPSANPEVEKSAEIISKPEDKPVESKAAAPNPVVVTSNPRKMYHLIAGSFLDAENTGSLIQYYIDLGYNPSIIGPAANGYYRVSIVAYPRKAEALVELQSVRKKYNPDIWLLHQ